MPTLYSRAPWRRARQIAGDTWLVGWTALWIWIAIRLHDLIMNLAAPGLALADGAGDFAGSIGEAGAGVAGVPLIGSALSAPFQVLSDASLSVAAAGQATADAVSKVALFASIALAVLAFASFAVFWVPLRVAFARRASQLQRMVAQDDALDLLALRALVRQPLPALASLGPDAAKGWRDGDPGMIAASPISSFGPMASTSRPRDANRSAAA